MLVPGMPVFGNRLSPLFADELHLPPTLRCFAVTFDECRMIGSSLAEASVSALTPKGGNWSFVCLTGLDLSRLVWENASFEGR